MFYVIRSDDLYMTNGRWWSRQPEEAKQFFDLVKADEAVQEMLKSDQQPSLVSVVTCTSATKHGKCYNYSKVTSYVLGSIGK